MRICYQRAKSETRLNLELGALEALKWDPVTMRIMEKNSPVNHQLNRLEQKFYEFITLNATNLPKYSANYIKDYVLGNNLSRQRSVAKFIDDYFAEAVTNNVNRSPGTVKNYRRSVNHFNNFLRLRKRDNLSFAEMNYEVAADFKNYLVSSDTRWVKKHCRECRSVGRLHLAEKTNKCG